MKICFFSTEFNYSLPLEEKVFGGQETQQGCRKFLASLKHKGRHICTAFLISNRHASTAAVCLDDFLKHPLIPLFTDYSLFTGTRNLYGVGSNHFIYQVEVCERHPTHTKSDSLDIGIITVYH